MNVLSTLKKIFNSYDFRGNRIKNLRVDTPDESIEYRESGKNIPNPDTGYFGPQGQNGPGGVQHYVANKIYADQKTTLNTDKAWKWINPFFFDWIKNVPGKPYKEIFDDLFFPLVQHEFISPEVTDVQIFAIERPLVDTLEIDNNFRKFVIYNRCINKFRIIVFQSRNEWISGLVGRLIIETYDGTIRTINSLDTSNEKSVFEFDVLWDNIKEIRFERVFDNYELRYDTYGNISNPPETTYTLKKVITDYFTKICYPFTLQYLSDNGWVCSDKIFIEAKTPKRISFQFDANLFTKQYCLKAYIFNENGEFLNWIIINHKDFTQTTLGTKTYDFGYFPQNVYIQIVPQAIRLI